MTRTYPINGRFTDEQRAIYDIVLEAQNAALERVVPGSMWHESHDAAVRVIARGLKRLGFINGTLASLIRDGTYRKFFMHRTGHWLGMDVHDVGDYKVSNQWRVLEPGMVLTVEPGIYIGENQRELAKQWRGIGIRIEDDVLVTRDGHEVLTKSLPREPKEVEALVGSALN